MCTALAFDLLFPLQERLKRHSAVAARRRARVLAGEYRKLGRLKIRDAHPVRVIAA